jgi:hypothetical protein
MGGPGSGRRPSGGSSKKSIYQNQTRALLKKAKNMEVGKGGGKGKALAIKHNTARLRYLKKSGQ